LHQIQKKSENPSDIHAIYINEGKLYFIKTVFENQPNILSARASFLTLENTVILNAI
jgi:hypothetical protein